MRKKIIVGLLLAIVVLLLVYNNHRYDLYYFADNENGYFDEIFEMTATLPTYETLYPSKEKLQAISNVEGVEGVYPYFYVTSLSEGESWETTITEVEVCADGQTYVVEFPKKVLITEEETTVIGAVSCRTYATEKEYFTNKVLERTMISSDSGVFIPIHFYNALEVPEGTKSLQLTVSLSLPITSTIQSVHYTTPTDEYGIPYSDDEYDFYAQTPIIQRYQKVTYTFDVQGVCSGYSTSLNIPPQVAKDLLNQIDWSQIVLEENEVLWEPQTYMITLEKSKTLNSLGKQFDEVIDDFVLNIASTDETKSY